MLINFNADFLVEQYSKVTLFSSAFGLFIEPGLVGFIAFELLLTLQHKRSAKKSSS